MVRPRLHWHRVRFKSAGGLMGLVVRRITFPAGQVSYRQRRAFDDAVAVGAPLADVVRLVARSVFLTRWWQRGPFDPVTQTLRLPPDLQIRVVHALARPIPSPED